MSLRNEYEYLNSNFEEDLNGMLYKVVYEGDVIRAYELFNLEKVETIRIDNETVEDVAYTFDLDLGEYVEQSREERAEPLPPEPISDAERINELEQQLAQTNLDLAAVLELILG